MTNRLKKYRPKRLLSEAIKATKKSLRDKWSIKNIYRNNLDGDCALCKMFYDHNSPNNFDSCKACPLYQYSKKVKNPDEFGDCVDIYWRHNQNPTKVNAHAMRTELRKMLKWLEAQVEK